MQIIVHLAIIHNVCLHKYLPLPGMFRFAMETFGRNKVEICINSVGVCLEQDWMKTVQVNYVGSQA